MLKCGEVTVGICIYFSDLFPPLSPHLTDVGGGDFFSQHIVA